MTVCVVTEGQFDSELIKSLIKAKKIKHAQVFTAKGSSSAQSLARSLVGVKQLPVALILDADEHDPSRVEDRRKYLETMLGTTAPRNEWELILLVPEMEMVFFEVPGLLETLGLPAPTPVERERAKHRPHEVLADLISKSNKHRPSNSRQWLMGMFPTLPYEKIWQLEPFSRLQRFLEQHGPTPEAMLPDHQ
ncbi:hypothetical protein ACN28I_07325 [Archangium gephyra]|uniref:hypothetical protein n=1 Tax=Archangium gephyra TaxID=48 RepID=UPI003B7D8BCE